jgi:murein DD-endopeptidase MepM/ murein hydrolase activator NlpD
VLLLPQTSGEYTPNFKMFPDSRIIRGPYSSLDIEEFINRQPGYIRNVQGVVEIRQDNGIPVPRTVSIAEVIEQVSLEYSVDPSLLIMLLEFKAQWLSNPQPPDELISRPIVSASVAPLSEGIYYQLAWAANRINQGYYGWKSRGSNILGLPDGRRVTFHPELNPGTIALQYLFSLDLTQQEWEFGISPNGFYRLYTQYFGDPFVGAVDQVVNDSLVQPSLILPFEPGVMWRLTGGPHGGWGSGSAWASVDFAPAQESPSGLYCYVADDWITAVANGLIVRSRDGTIVLDLDGDGNESTGWTILYLHMNISEAVRVGETVVAGQRIGKPSCAGGVSSATHLHIARKFNGEWIPADCSTCMEGYRTPDFEMSGWIVEGIEDQEYQGYMSRGGTTIQAEQGWTTTINIIRGE